MGTQVLSPQQRQGRYVGGSSGPNQLTQLGTLAGGVAGAIYGGPAGAAAGANLGNMVGGLFGGGGGGSTPQYIEEKPQAEPIQTGPSDALARRMQQINNSDLAQIRQGINSLQYINDEETRAKLAKPLLQAEYLAKG
jgi:hypothetical protein